MLPSDSKSIKIANQIGDFLYENQCILKEFQIDLSVEKEKVLQFTRSGPSIRINFTLNNQVLCWQIEGGRSGSAKIGEFFRLNPFNDAKKACNLKLSQPKAVSSRIASIIKGLSNQTQRIFRHFLLGGYDVDTRGLTKDLIEGILKPERSSDGGFVCRWTYDRDKVKVEVVDHGGILDDNPNVEAQRFEPRVMTNYYADGYSAYIFLRKFEESNDEQYFTAAIENIEFLLRTYEGYPRGLTWMHHEFKNPALIECLALLERWGRLPDHFRDSLKILRLDRYEPTNVFALRYYWKVLLREFGGRADEKRIQACRDRLKQDQTEEGLIMDNNPPMYLSARDLTYHQYSLACLAGALDFGVEDPVVRDIFLKGVAFSRAVLLGNGELSYNGRGANNIYHVASAIYAFSFAHRKYGFEISSITPMLERLEEYACSDGSLPTAMNPFAEERMGWNHCRTPYNALTAFLLLKAQDAGLPDGDDYSAEISSKQFLKDSGYAVYRCETYEAALFTGLCESYVYSGAHRTGVSGLAAFLPKGGKPLNLILNRSLRDDGALATDLPTIIYNGIRYEPIGGQLSETDLGYAWTNSTEAFVYTRDYCFEPAGLRFQDCLEIKKQGALSVENAFAWPLNLQGYTHKFVGKDVLFSPLCSSEADWKIQCNVSEEFTWSERSIVSNPRGQGVLLTFNLGKRSVEISNSINWQVSIKKN